MSRFLALVVIGTLLLLACGPGEPPAAEMGSPPPDPTITPPGDGPSSEVPTDPSTATDAAAGGNNAGGNNAGGNAGGNEGGAAAGSPFQRRDVPPGGLAVFLEFMHGGTSDGPCPDEADLIVDDDGPTFYLFTSIVPTAVCVTGLIPRQPVQLLLRVPGGAEWRTELDAGDFGVVEWVFEEFPRRIEGEYFVRATQSGLEGAERFVVDLDRLSAGLLPRGIPRRGSGELAVAGGEARAAVSAHIYEFDEAPDGELRWSYLSNLGSVRLNRRGEGRLEIPARRGDPLGTYLLVVDPTGANIQIEFAVVRRRTDDPAPPATTPPTETVEPTETDEPAAPAEEVSPSPTSGETP